LERTGDASIMANTSIQTVENQPAVFDLSETRYVQSVGERVAEFESITAGTLLHVVPRNIESGKDDQVQLLVEIEDGQIVDQTNNRGLPTVKKIAINTSAVVDEGRSLCDDGRPTGRPGRDRRAARGMDEEADQARRDVDPAALQGSLGAHVHRP